MSELALLAPPPASLQGAMQRGRRLLAQPAVRRTLPALAALLVLALGAGAWLMFRTPDYRPLFPALADADKAAVVAALTTGNYTSRIDPATGTIEVPADEIAAARIMLAGQGLPKAAASGVDMLGTMPLGSSRAVETARLKAAQEGDLAASIMAIDGVERASVHLAAGEVSVFVHDAAAPTASVFVRLAPGRALGDAQVRAIVHLVASSVSGLAPDRVSVVDQSGALLSGDPGSGALGDAARQLGHQARVEEGLRRRIGALLTPMLGPGNFAAQVSADLDFAANESTRESFDKDAVLRTDATTAAIEASLPPARGIPGALSNTPPPAAQLAATLPVPAAPTAPAATRNESYTRSFEVGKAVSVTRDAVGQIRRLSVAVVVRDGALGPVKGQPAQVATLTSLVRSAVGFDARRGDVVTVAGRPFVAGAVDPAMPWWELPLVTTGVVGAVVLTGIALLVFGVVRPLLKRTADVPQHADELAPPPLAVDYADKLAATRLLVGQDVGRASAVVRQMIRTDAA